MRGTVAGGGVGGQELGGGGLCAGVGSGLG